MNHSISKMFEYRVPKLLNINRNVKELGTSKKNTELFYSL
jgi:hypothetical protein